MNCRSCRDSLTALLDNELSSEEQTIVETHLSNCPDCHHEYDSLLFAFNLTDHINPIPLSPVLWTRIQGEIISPPFTGNRGVGAALRRAFVPLWRPVAAAVGSVTVVTILFFSFSTERIDPALEQEFSTFMQERETISRENRRILFEPEQNRNYRGGNPFVTRVSHERTNPFRE